MKYVYIMIVMVALIGQWSCGQSGDIFEDLGDNIASPSAMAIDVSSNRLYLVNSNSNVLYDWTQGSFQVLDISDPLAPVLVGTAQTQSGSGEIYLDATNSRAYVTNRYSESDEVLEDRMYAFNLDESSSGFLSFTETGVGRNAYAIACCYPDGIAWITTDIHELQYVNLRDDMSAGSIPLTTALDNGAWLSHAEVGHIALRDNQAFLSRTYGGVMVVNLDEEGAEGAVPVDYLISDVPNPRGIATGGTLLYVVGEGNESGSWKKFLLIIDISSLTPLVDNESTVVLDKDDDGLLVAMIELGRSPQEVLLSSDYAFVTILEDDLVSAIGLAEQAHVADIAVGDEPFSMALYTAAEGVDQYLYVGNVESNTLSIIDIPSLSLAATYR